MQHYAQVLMGTRKECLEEMEEALLVSGASLAIYLRHVQLSREEERAN